MTTPDGAPAVACKLLDFGNTFGLSLHREQAKGREQTLCELHDAMGHTATGTHCRCGSPTVATDRPPPGVRAEAACGDGLDMAARMWADGWRHAPRADRITLTLTAEQVGQLVTALQGWLTHRREKWIPADNEVRRLRGEPLHSDDPTPVGDSQGGLFDLRDVS